MTESSRLEELATTANGESVTADALSESAGDLPVARLLDADEQPHYILRGRVLDIADRDGPESDFGKRRRKVAASGSDLYTLVTDDRFLFVVPHSNTIDQLRIPLSDVASVETETAPGASQRLRVFTDETAYYVDTSQSDGDEAEAVRAFAADRAQADGPSGDGAEDVLDTIEWLADLHERGALTDEEFTRKKSELLDRL